MKSIAFVRGLIGLFLCSQLVWFMLVWVIPVPVHVGPVVMRFSAPGLDAGGLALSGAQIASGAVLALPALLLLAWALWRLDCLLRAFQRGCFFTLESIGHLRAFAGLTLLSLAWSLAETPARALLWRHLLDRPEAKMSASVSSEQLGVMLLCVVFYVIADSMHEGRRLAEENEGFV